MSVTTVSHGAYSIEYRWKHTSLPMAKMTTVMSLTPSKLFHTLPQITNICHHLRNKKIEFRVDNKQIRNKIQIIYTDKYIYICIIPYPGNDVDKFN